jgi:hypothetical protein
VVIDLNRSIAISSAPAQQAAGGGVALAPPPNALSLGRNFAKLHLSQNVELNIHDVSSLHLEAACV